MFFLCYFNFNLMLFLSVASFDGLRPLLVACHCQPFCSLANKLRSFVKRENFMQSELTANTKSDYNYTHTTLFHQNGSTENIYIYRESIEDTNIT